MNAVADKAAKEGFGAKLQRTWAGIVKHWQIYCQIQGENSQTYWRASRIFNAEDGKNLPKRRVQTLL